MDRNTLLWPRKLDWTFQNNMFRFLRHVFVELWEKTWDKLYLKHVQFQIMMNYYDLSQDLVEFLDNWKYEFYKSFKNFSDLKEFVKVNPNLLTDVKTWKINVALIYNDMIPCGIVFAKKNWTEQDVNDYIDNLSQKILWIVEFDF